MLICSTGGPTELVSVSLLLLQCVICTQNHEQIEVTVNMCTNPTSGD